MPDAEGVIEAGFVAALAAYAPGVTFYGARVYTLDVPEGPTLPYVLITYFGGGDRNLQPTRMIAPRFLVECVSEKLSVARTGAGHIETALTGVALTLTGWNWMYTYRRDGFQRVERDKGVVCYRRGAFFETGASQL